MSAPLKVTVKRTVSPSSRTSSRTSPWRRNERVPRSSRWASASSALWKYRVALPSPCTTTKPMAATTAARASHAAGLRAGRGRAGGRRGRRARGPRSEVEPTVGRAVVAVAGTGVVDVVDGGGHESLQRRRSAGTRSATRRRPAQDPRRVPADGDDGSGPTGEDVAGVVHQALTASASARRSAMRLVEPGRLGLVLEPQAPEAVHEEPGVQHAEGDEREEQREEHQPLELHVEGGRRSPAGGGCATSRRRSG